MWRSFWEVKSTRGWRNISKRVPRAYICKVQKMQDLFKNKLLTNIIWLFVSSFSREIRKAVISDVVTAAKFSPNSVCSMAWIKGLRECQEMEKEKENCQYHRGNILTVNDRMSCGSSDSHFWTLGKTWNPSGHCCCSLLISLMIDATRWHFLKFTKPFNS